MNTMPSRTIEPATPWAPSLAPNSSAAKAAVWLNSALQKPTVSCAAARRPSTWAARASSRCGGAHHGWRPPWRRWSGGRSEAAAGGAGEDPAEPGDGQAVGGDLGDGAVGIRR